jgi:DNA-binding response OmpR family regulator
LPPTILVVDDDLSIREMVRSVLTREGFDVVIAGTGNDAIALLHQNGYDAVVLDIMMGEGSGQDVLDALARQRPDVKCVVVISSTSVSKLEDFKGANIGAKLRKPFDIQELVEAVRNCVRDDRAPGDAGA